MSGFLLTLTWWGYVYAYLVYIWWRKQALDANAKATFESGFYQKLGCIASLSNISGSKIMAKIPQIVYRNAL